ncbi:hypothetical protein CCAX7_37850 [Capsulimonas corticalis]|uniref:Uncharacterized protein n=1 Tax=Capsulimonas corticalis TaxID=2219043 RepID=A0A402D0Y8_9BACT|nr:hypothetical protein [Capsulimonas corticalis]BDI31734.1 hypothetical protein CCAX7_37850 [Capsulimonas corticalis]
MRLRFAMGSVVAFAAAFGLNQLLSLTIANMIFQDPALYDGSVGFFTLIVPAFAGGLLGGLIGKTYGMQAAAAAFAVWLVAGALHPFWRVLPVTPASAHNLGLYFLVRNPVVALAFGTLGGWLGAQFATGRFTLADRMPVVIDGLEE